MDDEQDVRETEIEDETERVEESVRDEGRDEAAVTIAAIDSKLDRVLEALGELTGKVEALPTFEGIVESGAAVVDNAPASVEVALPTSDLSDLDLTIN